MDKSPLRRSFCLLAPKNPIPNNDVGKLVTTANWANNLVVGHFTTSFSQTTNLKTIPNTKPETQIHPKTA
jgi:hypothetical protein